VAGENMMILWGIEMIPGGKYQLNMTGCNLSSSKKVMGY
jgi:hypothetical protein